MKARGWWFALLVGVGGCAQDGLAPFPAVFEGTLPCADCPGIHYRLALAEDGTYTLHRRYEDRAVERDENGRWVYSKSEHRVTAHASNGSSEWFRVVSGDRLESLDRSGNPIESNLDYALVRPVREIQ